MARRPTADFRERLVAAIDAGLPRREAAQHFRVSRRTIDRWLARHRRASLADKPRSGRPPKLQASHYPVCGLVAAQPDATLPEVARQLAAAVGVQLSPSHLSRLLAASICRSKKVADCPRTR